MTHVSGTIHRPSLRMPAMAAALFVAGVVVGIVAVDACRRGAHALAAERRCRPGRAAGVAENNMTDAVRAAQLAIEAQRARAAAAGVAENNMTDAVRAAQLAIEAQRARAAAAGVAENNMTDAVRAAAARPRLVIPSARIRRRRPLPPPPWCPDGGRYWARTSDLTDVNRAL